MYIYMYIRINARMLGQEIRYVFFLPSKRRVFIIYYTSQIDIGTDVCVCIYVRCLVVFFSSFRLSAQSLLLQESVFVTYYYIYIFVNTYVCVCVCKCIFMYDYPQSLNDNIIYVLYIIGICVFYNLICIIYM